MDLYEFFSVAECLVIIGIVSIVVEVLFFGFSTFFLLFMGLSCIITGVLMSLSIIPESTIYALSFVSIFSIILAVGLWKHLKRLQNPADNNEIEVGLVGHKFELNSDLSPDKALKYRYSGVDWIVKSPEAIKAGQTVKVINLDVGVLIVTKAEK